MLKSLCLQCTAKMDFFTHASVNSIFYYCGQIKFPLQSFVDILYCEYGNWQYIICFHIEKKRYRYILSEGPQATGPLLRVTDFLSSRHTNLM